MDPRRNPDGRDSADVINLHADREERPETPEQKTAWFLLTAFQRLKDWFKNFFGVK